MPFLPPKFILRNAAEPESLSLRILENVRLALAMPQTRLRVASSAALPFSQIDTSMKHGTAQGVSGLAHMAILCVSLSLFAAHRIPLSSLRPTTVGEPRPLLHYVLPTPAGTGRPSLGMRGGGSGSETAPARAGLLAPRSSMPLTKPRLTRTEQEELPVPPAVFDANAPASVPLITNLGLPWMTKDTNSAGPGKGHGIGNGKGEGMGDDEGDGIGRGNDGGDYANVVSLASCVYCPEPPYTEEARKAKLQGNVTLQVLIGTDGRAKQVQIVKGLGMGLDERASEAVRSWRFAPARNSQRQPIPSWAIIETRFQLL